MDEAVQRVCRKAVAAMWEEKLKVYDALIAKCSRFERKGKTGPYTSANGYMFSFFNKAGEIGIRFSKEVQERYLREFNTAVFKIAWSGDARVCTHT